MRCEKHKIYKGLRPTKRNCPNCILLYKTVQTKLRSELSPIAPYQSITTPDKRLSLIGILAEISCLMLYGRLPSYFWNRKGTDYAKHYGAVFRSMLAWQKRDKKTFKALHTILYHTYTQYAKEMVAEQVRDQEVVEDDDFEEDLDSVDFEVDKRALKKIRGRRSLRNEFDG